MKRSAAGIAGVVYGLLLTWLSLYAFSHMEWHRSRSAGPGCLDIGNCEVWAGVLIVGDLLLFPVLFGVLNSVAWRRWTVRRWGCWGAGLSVLTAMFHLTGYVL